MTEIGFRAWALFHVRAEVEWKGKARLNWNTGLQSLALGWMLSSCVLALCLSEFTLTVPLRGFFLFRPNVFRIDLWLIFVHFQRVFNIFRYEFIATENRTHKIAIRYCQLISLLFAPIYLKKLPFYNTVYLWWDWIKGDNTEHTNLKYMLRFLAYSNTVNVSLLNILPDEPFQEMI